MANFSGGGSFSAGFARGGAITGARKTREFNEAEAIRERLQESITAAKETSENNFNELVKVGAEIAGKGGSTKEVRQAAIASTLDYANTLRQFEQMATASGGDPQALGIPSSQQFIRDRMAILDTTLAAGPDFRTLTPEELEGTNFPEGSVVQMDEDNQFHIKFDPTKATSNLQQKLQFLVDSGVSENTAKGILGGRFEIIVDPISKEGAVWDLGASPPKMIEALGETPQPASDSGSELITGDEELGEATGVPGILRNVANIAVSAFGGDLPFEEAQQTTDALTNLRLMTVTKLQEEIPGRPSNFLLQELDKVSVNPNAFTQGESRALSRLKSTRQLIHNEIRRMEDKVVPSKLDPKTRVEVNNNLSDLVGLRSAYDDLISNAESPDEVPDDVPAEFSAEDKARAGRLKGDARDRFIELTKKQMGIVDDNTGS
jgi:hypothetical protein